MGRRGAAVREAAGAVVVTAAGTPRGNEVLAHVGARLGVPMAANAIAFHGLSPFVVSRQVVGGAAIEEMRWASVRRSSPWPGTRSRPAESGGDPARVVATSPEVAEADLVARVVSREAPPPDLLGQPEVGPRRRRRRPRCRRAEGFADVEELASLLDGTIGVSRVVTSLGWRPHHEQVGQTGSRISPELYVACGISGAIQHWSGCASSKTILAINTDAEAPMVSKAHYAVIGDMHEILPAVNEELRRRRG